MSDEIRGAIEALLLVAEVPLSTELLSEVVDLPVADVERTLHSISDDLNARSSGIELARVGDGWRYLTRAKYAPHVERMLTDASRSKLTRAALETLAVVAYRQPVTRARVGAVRGVNVDGVMRSLLARGLIAEAGSDDQTHATTYRTTELFLERLGLSSLEELPPIAPLLPETDVIDELNESLNRK